MPPKSNSKEKEKEAVQPVVENVKFCYIDCSNFQEEYKMLVCTNCSLNILIHNTKLQCIKLLNDKMNKLKSAGCTGEYEIALQLKDNLTNQSIETLDLIDSDGNSTNKSAGNTVRANDVLKAKKVYKFVFSD